MKAFFANFLSILLISYSAFAVTDDMASAIYAGLSGKIDAFEECSLDTDDNRTVIRGTHVNVMIVCYSGMGTKYDEDRYYIATGVMKGNGKDMIFSPTKVEQIQYEDSSEEDSVLSAQLPHIYRIIAG
jgi:hypothetical protein